MRDDDGSRYGATVARTPCQRLLDGVHAMGSTVLNMSQAPARPIVDPAALGSAAMAAVFALVVSPGIYGWLSTGAGIALLLLLAGYYRPLYWPPTGSIDALACAAAFGSIAGLLVGMALSWPIQAVIGTSGCDGSNTTACSAEVDAAGWWVAFVWLAAGIVLTIAHLRLIQPSVKPMASPLIPDEESHLPPPSSAPPTHPPASGLAPGAATPQEAGNIVTDVGAPSGGELGYPRSTVHERADE